MLRAAIITAFFALSATAAHAETSTQVAFGDLNLSRPADIQILADRLETAAKAVCLDANSASPNISRSEMHECVDNAVAIAITRIEDLVRQRLASTVHANLVSVRQQVIEADKVQH